MFQIQVKTSSLPQIFLAGTAMYIFIKLKNKNKKFQSESNNLVSLETDRSNVCQLFSDSGFQTFFVTMPLDKFAGM